MTDDLQTRRFPLSRSEYGIYMNERAFPGSAINTIGFMLRFPTVTMADLCLAADQVIDAVPIFGCRLIEENGAPMLEWSPARPAHTVCSRTPLTTWEASDVWEQRAASPITDGMYDLTVHPLKGGGSVLMARMHHILLDGFDMCKLVRCLLDALAGNAPEAIPFSHMEDKALDVAKERSFWLDQFYDADYEPAVMQESTDSIRRKRLRISLGAGISGLLREFAKQNGVTPASIFSAALALYLARAADKPDAVFIMPRLGRDTQAERAAYGCHTQAIPVRINVDETLTFPQLCKRAYETAKTASAHKAYGIASIPSLFRDAAKRFADRPALYAGDVTFAALDAVSNRIANALLAQGVQQGQTVMYKLRRDEKPIPVMLGILKAGGAFIPIDPAYPQGRIDDIQRNSGSSMMIVNDPSAESEAVSREGQ